MKKDFMRLTSDADLKGNVDRLKYIKLKLQWEKIINIIKRSKWQEKTHLQYGRPPKEKNFLQMNEMNI